ncbi:YlcI/YnfO family protein [Aquincola tertiaricarbonis]|uniref:YlcI/YnfO family protein n=1 Tax=Aquincola tertiaricarbonis TaxID=391953 RepID=UPI00069790B5|nr:YlcI/YnfO family protein [Aquincola tertiaricarbonis]
MSKNAILPQVRVPTELRRDAEACLAAGESLSQLVEAAVRTEIRTRALRAGFLAGGMEAVLQYDEDGKAVDADDFVRRLERKLEAALTARRRTAT